MARTGGRLLRSLDGGLWVADGNFKAFGISLGARMTVVRLPDQSLFGHSPSRLDDGLRAALDAAGPVRHLVAPNTCHHLFLGDYRDAYPDARLYGAPGVAAKRSDIAFDEVLSDEVPGALAEVFDQAVLHGMPRFNEVLFCHRPTRSLLVTDCAFNIFESPSLFTRLFFKGMGVYGRFGPSRLFRSTIKDHAALRASLDRVLLWNFDRVIVTHGIVLHSHGKRLLREAYAWLDPGARETD